MVKRHSASGPLTIRATSFLRQKPWTRYLQLSSTCHAIKEEKIILYCEGEKDCLTAHCWATKPRWVGPVTGKMNIRVLQVRECRLIPDKDDPGLKLSARMQESLTEVAKSLKVVVLPEGKI